MAKYETQLRGNFQEVLDLLSNKVMSGSMSASFEDSSRFAQDGIRCATQVFERYSMAGGNRVSMNLTLFGRDDDLHLSVITSGGSQATFFKLNTWGEETFLSTLTGFVEDYKRSYRG